MFKHSKAPKKNSGNNSRNDRYFPRKPTPEDLALAAIPNDEAHEPNRALMRALLTADPLKVVTPVDYNPTPAPYKRSVTKLNNPHILDAPALSNDYYLNMLTYTNAGESIVIALDSTLYQFNRLNPELITEIPRQAPVTSVASVNNYLAYGLDTKKITVLDSNNREFANINLDSLNYATNITPTESNPNTFYFTMSRLNQLGFCDLRDNGRFSINTLFTHRLIGLAYHAEKAMVAVNNGENTFIYDARNGLIPMCTLSSKASKGLTFSPHERLSYIATGGGSNDGLLKIWNISTQTLVSEFDLGAQICGIHWLDKQNIAITSGAGPNSAQQNRVSSFFWAKEDTPIKQEHHSPDELGRVLYSAQNPKNSTEIITASSDETLRFWKANISTKPTPPSSKNSALNITHRFATLR